MNDEADGADGAHTPEPADRPVQGEKASKQASGGKATDERASGEVAPKRQSAASLAAAYFLARLGIFLVILAILWAVGFRGLPGALAAAIISIPVSFFALSKMRVATAQRLEERQHDRAALKSEFKKAGRRDD